MNNIWNSLAVLQNTFNGFVYALRWNIPHSDLHGMFTALCITPLSDYSQYPHLNKQTQNNQTWQVKEKKCWQLWKTLNSQWGYNNFQIKCHEYQTIAYDLIANSPSCALSWQYALSDNKQCSHLLEVAQRTHVVATAHFPMRLNIRKMWLSNVSDWILSLLLPSVFYLCYYCWWANLLKHTSHFQGGLVEQMLLHFIPAAKDCSLKHQTGT